MTKVRLVKARDEEGGEKSILCFVFILTIWNGCLYIRFCGGIRLGSKSIKLLFRFHFMSDCRKKNIPLLL